MPRSSLYKDAPAKAAFERLQELAKVRQYQFDYQAACAKRLASIAFLAGTTRKNCQRAN